VHKEIPGVSSKNGPARDKQSAVACPCRCDGCGNACGSGAGHDEIELLIANERISNVQSRC
jgi:hypothetical protein